MSLSFDDDFASPVDWARMYRARGIQVVPGHAPRPHFQWKRPALREWKTFQEELVPDAVFDRWYGARGEYAQVHNMGILTGRASGNIVVIDLDTHKNAAAMDWWRGVLELHNHGFEPETWQQVTGGGGKQLFFRAPANWVAPTNRTAIGVDVRGQGGFAVLPPSPHESGQTYRWIPGLSPWETEIETAEAWLLEEVEKLVGDSRDSRDSRVQRTSSPETDFNAFGTRVDGREEYMTKLIWAAVIDLYRQCPIKPLDTRNMEPVYEVYERKVKTRLQDPSTSKRDLLEREGRGYSLFRDKWQRALSKWDDEIRAEAGHEKQEQAQRGQTQPPPPGNDDPGPFSVTDFTGPAPERKWIVLDWIAEGVVNSLYGEPGVGKTLLAQQLAYCLSIKHDFLGIPVEKKKVFCVLCEDEREELHRRHENIKAGLGHRVGNPFEDVTLWPRIGYDNILVTWNANGEPQVSKQFAVVLAEVLKRRPDLLVLDTLADFFGGNEIVRAQVNHFLKAVLAKLILEARAADFVLTVLLLAHPSNAGVASGTGESGSTAWGGGVRARSYLRRPKNGHKDERELVRPKSNYSESGEDTLIRLMWQNGMFVRAEVDADSLALRSAKTHVTGLIRAAWDRGKPYKERKGHPLNLYSAIVKALGSISIPKEIAIQAIRELEDDGEIELKKGHRKRGYKVAEADPDDDE